MAVFFDTGDSTHTALLHSSVRSDAELDNVVDAVEWSILHYYKERPSLPVLLETGKENLISSGELEIRLTGYDEETPANSNTELKEALKRTIAMVASYKLRKYNETENVKSKSLSKRSIEYWSQNVGWDSFPDGWRWILNEFDEREGQWHI